MSDLVFLIPALNEEQTISLVISSLVDYGSVVVVDDGSIDNTAQIARSSGAKVLAHTIRKGYDAALLTGFKFAIENNYSWLITIDADGQHCPTNIPELVMKINSMELPPTDIFLGVRHSLPRFGEHLLAALYRRLWGVKDPLCGLKVYRLDFVRALNFQIEKTFDSLGTELLLIYLNHSANFKEFPVTILPRLDKSRFGGTFKVNLRLVKCLFRTFFRYSLGK